MNKQHLRPLTFASAHVAVGSSSVCRPVAAACIVPAPPAAAGAAATPGQELLYDHSSKTIKKMIFKLSKSLI